MPRPLAIIRPQPGWDATAELARHAGLTVIGHPLSEYQAVAWSLPSSEFDAILAGSGAAFRHGGPELARFRHIPVLAVGKATAWAARDAGFEVAITGVGGLQTILDEAGALWPRLLRLAGDERIPLAKRPGQTIVERVVYRTRALPIEAEFAEEIRRSHPVVALHSAATARHFEAECVRLGLAISGLDALALGPRIARAVGEGWANVHSAGTSSDVALIGKAVGLCK